MEPQYAPAAAGVKTEAGGESAGRGGAFDATSAGPAPGPPRPPVGLARHGGDPLADALAWLRAAALQSGRRPEAEGGVLGGAREAAATRLLAAARRCMADPRCPPPEPTRPTRRTAGAFEDMPYRSPALAASSERKEPRVGEWYQAELPRMPPPRPAGGRDARQRPPTPREAALLGTAVWPPPDGSAAPHSLRVGPPPPPPPPKPLPPLPPPAGLPPWPGSAAACAARAERAATAAAATSLLCALLGPQAASALGVSRIGAADGVDWTPAEVSAFAAAVAGPRGRGDFRHVAASLPGRRKSVARCVSFYYNVWKLMLVPEAVAHYDARAAERAERGNAPRAAPPRVHRAVGGAAAAARAVRDPALRAYAYADDAVAPAPARLTVRPPPGRSNAPWPALPAAPARDIGGGGDDDDGGGGRDAPASRGVPIGAPAHPLPRRDERSGSGERRSASERGIGPLRGPLGGKRGLTGKSRSGLRKPKVMSLPAFAAARKAAGAPASRPAQPHSLPRPTQPVATRVGYAGYQPLPPAAGPAVVATRVGYAGYQAPKPRAAAPKPAAKPPVALAPYYGGVEGTWASPPVQRPAPRLSAARAAAVTAAFAADFGGGSEAEDDHKAEAAYERKRRRLAEAAAFTSSTDEMAAGGASGWSSPPSSKKGRPFRSNALAAQVNNRAKVDARTAALLMASEAAPMVTSKARTVAATAHAAIITPTATSEIVAHALAKAADKSMAITFDPKHSGMLVNPLTGRVYPHVPGTITSTPSNRGGVGGKFDAETTRLLAAAFELNPFPNRATKIALAAQTGLTPEQTRVWFMNARSRGVRL